MSKIKFTHAPNGEIEVNNGKTSYSDIFTIGALRVASETIFPGNQTYFTKYPTDKEGLEVAVLKSGELLTALHDAISVIGVLMAYANPKDIQEDIHSVSWLIAGLGELAEMVSSTESEMTHSLSIYDEMTKKEGGEL